MTDTKPTATATATTTTKPPPPNKSQPNNNNNNLNRHPYRPNPNPYHHRNHHRHRRSYLCLCCFWSILILILLLLLSTIAACILYLLYRPHRPTFSVTSLKISQFNLTTATSDDTTHLTSTFNLTLSTRNPNKKVVFYYDPIEITCLYHETQIANGSFPISFSSDPNNITIVRSSLYGNSLLLESSTVNEMRSDLKKKKYGMPLKILLDTEARVKVESVMSKKVGIRIECEGIHSFVPKNGGKARNSSTSVTAMVSEAKCKVDLRIKIWKWTFSS